MSAIAHFIHGGGAVMYPLLFLSLLAVTVIVERLIAYNRFGHIPGSLLGDVIDLCRNGRHHEAEDACRAERGPMAACLAIVVEHRNQPTREVERLVEEAGQEYFLKLEHLLPVLDTTTTIAPLLGLLGTIVGMIGAFNAIALQTHHGNNDSVLAGVGEALYATATGLVVAVICFAAYNYFSARLRTITGQTEQAATKLMNVLIESHRHSVTPDPSARGRGESTGKETVDAVQTASRA